MSLEDEEKTLSINNWELNQNFFQDGWLVPLFLLFFHVCIHDLFYKMGLNENSKIISLNLRRTLWRLTSSNSALQSTKHYQTRKQTDSTNGGCKCSCIHPATYISCPSLIMPHSNYCGPLWKRCNFTLLTLINFWNSAWCEFACCCCCCLSLCSETWLCSQCLNCPSIDIWHRTKLDL